MAGQKINDLFCWEIDFEGIRVFMGSTNNGLAMTGIGFISEEDSIAYFAKRLPAANTIRDYSRNRVSAQAIETLLRGETPRVKPMLDITLTDFQMKVMESISKIPFGATKTYGEIAAALGKAKGARAVGQAVGRNPVPIVFP
ncbi:MAG: methylated-DNA--[protein]-cysteine S-methyltransferase [Desulfobacteraceae bacterium]|jgi:O6-methylguanine-DNA--protein-cysteine methyltransferase|nr:MAG: methylated-DNA--[protein]-cysteine S-methyltransferase [Desulfobacteraceae bacterium]